MTITIIARVVVKEGKMEEAISILKKVIPKIKASEPGCLEYITHTVQKEKNVILFYEKYANKEAFEAHNKNLRTNMVEFNPLLEPGAIIEVCSEII
ncbi:MAG: antibiotic biosynthesis monooxygenase [Candidatus Lokiarchaeota archaeon]|nr:antibiotic biosynthesis monooxygenase [Candidatus Lokiarchaeota archaeon]